jgi:hypothetical protein
VFCCRRKIVLPLPDCLTDEDINALSEEEGIEIGVKKGLLEEHGMTGG